MALGLNHLIDSPLMGYSGTSPEAAVTFVGLNRSRRRIVMCRSGKLSGHGGALFVALSHTNELLAVTVRRTG